METHEVNQAVKNQFTQTDVEARMIVLRKHPVLIDTYVAALYGGETKRVNEAAKNNPGKFPYGILFELDKYEKAEIVEKFAHFNKLKFSKGAPEHLRSRINSGSVPIILPLFLKEKRNVYEKRKHTGSVQELRRCCLHDRQYGVLERS